MKREEYTEELRKLYKAALEQKELGFALEILERLRKVGEPLEVPERLKK